MTECRGRDPGGPAMRLRAAAGASGLPIAAFKFVELDLKTVTAAAGRHTGSLGPLPARGQIIHCQLESESRPAHSGCQSRWQAHWQCAAKTRDPSQAGDALASFDL